MNVVGLITEYNPFHNGHKYHIEEAKRITQADYVVVVMSGNFVQRGTPAFLDKYSRAHMALYNGADLVFELPTCFATASAEYFALGGISLLNSLGFVNSIVFGSECGDIHLLTEVAKLLVNEPPKMSLLIQEYMKAGQTYPTARANAIDKFIDSNGILRSPNNILGIEYIKALLKLNSPMKPYTIARIGAGFHDTALTPICSATGIRSMLEHSTEADTVFTTLRDRIPETVYDILKQNYSKTCPVTTQDMNSLLRCKLLSETSDSLTQYLDITDDLAKRIMRQTTTITPYHDFVTLIKSKQYTQTRIQRCLCHVLLNITSADMKAYALAGYSQYARLLGFKKSATKLLRPMKDNDCLRDCNFIVTKLGSTNLSPIASKMLETDLLASRIYNLMLYDKFQYVEKDEYKHELIIL